ncbi:MAG: hypothetical protein DRJ03_01925 [Chloroflexi bacterium]|nr:MAG: hypothetical protein DRJ03_01925 [Chloroflexota bacterium]
MAQSIVTAYIEGPVCEGVVVDTLEGVQRVVSVSMTDDNQADVVLEAIVSDAPARAVYPVLCPGCRKVFVCGVEEERFLVARDMERDKQDDSFFVMPALCHMCAEDNDTSFTA